MNRIQQALTRKLGPFPAWAWGGLFAVAVYIYRRRAAAAGGQDGTSPADTLSYYGPYGDNVAPIQGGSFDNNPTGGPPVVNIYGPGHHKTKHQKPKKKKTPKSTKRNEQRVVRQHSNVINRSPAHMHAPRARQGGSNTQRATRPRTHRAVN